MTRLARDRDTHLTREEIATETLRQFDEEASAPSIRSLAAALQVTPSAIYHHFPSHAAIVQAAVDLVWQETADELVTDVPTPFIADPAETLVAAGVAMRRSFLRHYRIVPYAAATPAEDGVMATALAMMANLFERMGLQGDEAAAAFHTYASLTIGAAIFAATRRIANDELARGDDPSRPTPRFHANPGAGAASLSSEQTRLAIDEVMDISSVDPARDEQLYAEGLRRLVASFAPAKA